MIIQNSIKLLNEISKLETDIKKIETLIDNAYIEIDYELYLKSIYKSYSDS